MTTISTVVGIGMMPLNAWIYSRSWVDHKTTVPIANIMIGLASMLIPVAIGMVIKIKLQKVAKVLPTVIIRPRCEKTSLRGFRPGPTQTGLYNHRRCLEA